ncbi:MAG: type IV secretion system DNA-binding domain-containing protein [Proteobacteria bacterium]|nr:type IV secretion system DNA-binding domain-containing protein [Pseudomonadota bacterium]
MKKKKAALYRGFETIYSESIMSWKMMVVMFSCAILLHGIIYISLSYFWLTEFERHVLFTFIKGWITKLFSPDAGIAFIVNEKNYTIEAQNVSFYLSSYILPHIALTKKLWVSFLVSLFSYLSIPVALKSFKTISEQYNEKEYVKGAKLIEPEKLNKKLKNQDLPFAQVKLPKEFEIQHVFFIGATGAGKTVFLSQVLERIIERNENSLIYDNKGDFISKFYRPDQDLIFNPLDERCVGWNVFNEIKTEYDIDAVATSLIPPAPGDNVFWNDAARDVFAGILIYLFQHGKKTNQDIWKMVTMDIKRLSGILKNTKGAERGYVFIQDASSKQAVSIHAVLMQYAKSFSYLNIDGDFSITDWVRNPTGNIFVPNYANTKDTLKPILSLFVDLLGRQLLSLPDDISRRIFLFIDEFGSLQRLSTIMNLLTLGRSKGASVWIGIQDIGQLEKIYGKNTRQTIVNSCGNCVLFRVDDPTEANYLSDKIGKVTCKVPQENFSMGVENMRDGFGVTKVEKTEHLIMAAEIQAMKNLEAYIKFVGSDITKVKFDYKHFPSIHPAFVEDQRYRLDEKYYREINKFKNGVEGNPSENENLAGSGSGKIIQDPEIENKEFEKQPDKLKDDLEKKPYQPMKPIPKENVVPDTTIEKLEAKLLEREETHQNQAAIENFSEQASREIDL